MSSSLGSVKSRLSMRNIATSDRRRCMNRVSFVSKPWTLLGLVVQVVMRDDGASGKVAWTDYEVLSIPELSPRKCALIQLQPVTGMTAHASINL